MATAVNIIEFHGNQKMHFAIKRRSRRAYFTIYLLGRKFCSYCMWDIFLIKNNLKVNQIPWKNNPFYSSIRKLQKKTVSVAYKKCSWKVVTKHEKMCQRINYKLQIDPNFFFSPPNVSIHSIDYQKRNWNRILQPRVKYQFTIVDSI